MSFSVDIQKFADKAELNGNDVARKFALLGLQGVVKRSPVKTGTFRRAWNIGVGKADLETPPVVAEHEGPDAGATISSEEYQEAVSRLGKSKWGDTLFVTNSMPYAQVLEDGSSVHNEHQPDGILGVTVDGLEAHLAQITAQVSRS